MATSPTVRRRRLTAELRHLRETSGKTIEEVADAVGISKSTLSRIENGLVGVKTPTLRVLLGEYGVRAEDAARLEQLSKEASQRGWWQVGNQVSLHGLDTLIGLETEATRMWDYSATVIPGLLQTQEYATAIIQAMAPPDTDADAVAGSVDVRMKRQRKLDDLALHVILAQECLLRPIGGVEAQAAQIARLRRECDRSNIVIQVLPLDRGAHPGALGHFALLAFGTAGPEAAYIEGTLWDSLLEDAHELEHFAEIFRRINLMALDPDESTIFLERAAEDLSRGIQL